MSRSTLLGLALIVCCLTASASGECGEHLDCSKFTKLLDAKGDQVLAGRKLVPKVDSNGARQYEGFDFDGDGKNDELFGGCAASLRPADNCGLDLNLSSGKQYQFEFRDGERFFLVRIESRLYAIANSNHPGKRSVLTINKNGILRVCENL